jgi:predicted dehydrogenase
MKALIIGWGSIGKQHAAALEALGAECAVVTQQEAVGKVFRDIGQAVHTFKPTYVVVSNRTADHLQAVENLSRAGFSGKVLVEKPLFHTNVPVPPNTFLKLAVGYQLRFHPVVRELARRVKNERIISCHCYCGQYLPTWRPSTDYRSSYSSHREQGGGVLRDLSHELDYLTWILGKPIMMHAFGGKYSSLEIRSEDVVGISAQFEKCPVVTVQLNYLDRLGRRECTVVTDSHTFHADLVNSTFRIDADAPLVLNTSRLEMLQALHSSMIDDVPPSICTESEGLALLRYIEQIEAQLTPLIS